MISRRSFTALAGAALFGLFSRIRFAPSAGGPRGRRVRRGRMASNWKKTGEFEVAKWPRASNSGDQQLS